MTTTHPPSSLPGEYRHDKVVSPVEQVPDNLRRATSRLRFPPSYVVVGVYRLFTDKNLYVPAWQKCKHGAVRGVSVALIWTVTTFKIQRKFVEIFLIKSPSVTGLSRDAIFGIPMPFDLPTYATLFFLSSQFGWILLFFLSRNLRIARERAYDQTIASRGKGPDFWGPYVEEWDAPPRVSSNKLERFLGSAFGRAVVNISLVPFHLVPLAGMVISSALRALGTARHLHKPYFQVKHMTPAQVAVFIEERKWDYRAFGFAAALLERLPFVGLIFSISNRVGAAMWAHDLEKRQHYVASVKAGVHPQE